jgi:hypothetical protein
MSEQAPFFRSPTPGGKRFKSKTLLQVDMKSAVSMAGRSQDMDRI